MMAPGLDSVWPLRDIRATRSGWWRVLAAPASVRPTAQPEPKAKRERRRPDPFAKVTVQLHA